MKTPQDNFFEGLNAFAASVADYRKNAELTEKKNRRAEFLKEFPTLVEELRAMAPEKRDAAIIGFENKMTEAGVEAGPFSTLVFKDMLQPDSEKEKGRKATAAEIKAAYSGINGRDADAEVKALSGIVLASQLPSLRNSAQGSAQRQTMFDRSEGRRATESKAEALIRPAEKFAKVKNDFDEQLSELNSAANILATDSNSAEQTMIGIIAKHIGGQKGVLTDKDLDRLVEMTAEGTMQGLSNWVTGAAEGKLSPEQKSELQNIIKSVKAKAEARRAQVFADTARTYLTDPRVKDPNSGKVDRAYISAAKDILGLDIADDGTFKIKTKTETKVPTGMSPERLKELRDAGLIK